MKNVQFNFNKDFLKKRVGLISQFAGLKRYRLSEGRGDGVDAVDVRTGTGFDFTVLPGRGMDIAWANYKGTPVSYMSSTGISAAANYETAGMEWLRNFFAGLLTTCGLSNVGGPSFDEHSVIGRREYGLHGRITNISATEVCTKEEWKNGKYVMSVSGKMRESTLHGENVTLRRTITTVMGESKINLHDVIENESNRPHELMLLYHMNLGYPVLSEDTRLVLASESVKGASELAQSEIKLYDKFAEPEYAYGERCYFHKLKTNSKGQTKVAVINDKLELAVVFTYYPEQLPEFTEWKMLNEGEYVLGIEPGKSRPIGHERAKKEGGIQTLASGERCEVDVTIEIVDGKAKINKLEKEIKSF